MTTPTIRDHCAAQVNDVAYLLECIRDGSSDPTTLQEISDRANTARAALAAEAAGEGPTPAEIDRLTQQHTSDLGDLRIGVAPEDVPALVYAALARWGRPTTPPAPEVGKVVAWLRSNKSLQAQRAATLLSQLSAPAPAVVPVAVSERPWERDGGWLDLDSECWWCPPDGPAYWSMANPAMVYGGWIIPAHAIPMPQVGEVEG